MRLLETKQQFTSVIACPAAVSVIRLPCSMTGASFSKEAITSLRPMKAASIMHYGMPKHSIINNPHRLSTAEKDGVTK